EERDGYQIRRYRPRVEGLFARIERWTHAVTGDVHFRVVTRDDVLQVYGRSATARIADPAASWRGVSWLLEEARGARGNGGRYLYLAEDGAGVDPGTASEANRFEPSTDGSLRFLATAQRYLERIQYGNRAPIAPDEAAPDDASAWLFEVVLDYGDHDPDAPAPG